MKVKLKARDILAMLRFSLNPLNPEHMRVWAQAKLERKRAQKSKKRKKR
jgi:hypothetical protein